MKRFLLSLALLALPGAANAADIFCEYPWFVRNLIFDRAGYCFSSPLGQALFGNSDCTDTEVTLSPRDAAAVAHIQDLEGWELCEIDTSAQRLEHQDAFQHLRQMTVLPIPVEHESGCIGYQGPDLPLLPAPGPLSSPVLGMLTQNADLHFGHLPEGGWEFVGVYPEGWTGGPAAYGWVDFGGQQPICSQYAG